MSLAGPGTGLDSAKDTNYQLAAKQRYKALKPSVEPIQ
jgi:hypothetical protein